MEFNQSLSSLSVVWCFITFLVGYCDGRDIVCGNASIYPHSRLYWLIWATSICYWLGRYLGGVPGKKKQ